LHIELGKINLLIDRVGAAQERNRKRCELCQCLKRWKCVLHCTISVRQDLRYCLCDHTSGEAHEGNSTPDRRQYDDKRCAKYDLAMSPHGPPRNNDRKTIRGASLRSCFFAIEPEAGAGSGHKPAI